MFKSIHLSADEIKNYKVIKDNKDDASEKILDGLSKINIFIGPNNSGKSTMLRHLFSNPNLEITVDEISPEKYNRILTQFKSGLIFRISEKRVRVDREELESRIKTIGYLTRTKEGLSGKWEALNQYKNFSVNTFDIVDYETEDVVILEQNQEHQIKNIEKSIQEKAITALDRLEKNHSTDYNEIMGNDIYIPTLRGLRPINHDEKANGVDNYRLRTQKDYFEKIDGVDSKIYTGLNLFDEVESLLLGNINERKKIKDFEDFLSRTFFNGEDFSIIPRKGKDVVFVKIGNAEDFPIYRLGDGIQSLIILIYPLFFNRGKRMNIFYEEPDMFLHPGFQRIFLETLSSPEFDSFQFFMTTHSNHFLDMTLDFDLISVYAFRKDSQKEEFTIENVNNDDMNLLQILGVRNSSVFLSNCTIWVEGITDRLYIRKYLELIQKTKGLEYHEDIHYSFVEYGGNNITHWSFLEGKDEDHPNINVKRLCGTLFLVSDNDGADKNKDGNDSAKLLRHKELKETLGANYECLDVREIENILNEEVLKKVIIEIEGGNNKNVDFSKLKYANYKNKYLGRFIHDNVGNIKRKYSAESGTIAYKVKFAKRAIKNMDNIDTISEEAKDLAGKIYKFIASNNS